VTVARLVEKKGLAFAIDAVAELRRRGHQLTYRIIGDGEERAALEAQITRLGLDGIVSLAGSQPHDVVAAELAAADIFLGPSVVDRFGESDAVINTVKEAMLTGLPVIATLHGGIPELVVDRQSGVLVPERDPAAIADAVQWLLDHPDQWHAMAEQARTAVEQRYGLEMIARQTVQVYRTALDHREARARGQAQTQLVERGSGTGGGHGKTAN
jgi:colanic acid/amylovoran biosynthesis glycosyltransferase